MNNTIYRLISPHEIKAEQAVINETDNQVIVKPTHMSICHADQRYYQGMRPPEVLAKNCLWLSFMNVSEQSKKILQAVLKKDRESLLCRTLHLRRTIS